MSDTKSLWRVRRWTPPVRDADRTILKPGAWKLAHKTGSTEEAMRLCREVLKETGRPAKATRHAPDGDPIEIYARSIGTSVLRMCPPDASIG